MFLKIENSRFWVVILMVTFLASTFSVHAGEEPADDYVVVIDKTIVIDKTTPVWKVTHMSNGADLYSYGECLVGTKTSGLGIYLKAVDNSDPKAVVIQTAKITKSENGIDIKIQHSLDLLEGVQGRSIQELDALLHDVFEVNCAAAAEYLPDEVKASFYGEYGLGKK